MQASAGHRIKRARHLLSLVAITIAAGALSAHFYSKHCNKFPKTSLYSNWVAMCVNEFFDGRPGQPHEEIIGDELLNMSFKCSC